MIVAQMDNKQALWFDALDAKDIAQSLIRGTGYDYTLPFVTHDVAINGIKQFIINGLVKKGLWKKDIEMDDYNPGNPDITDFYLSLDKKLTYQLEVPGWNGLITGFSSEANKHAFKRQLVDTLYDSLQKDLYHEWLRVLLTGDIKDDKGSTVQTITYDKDIVLSQAWDTKDNIEKGLEQIRKIILRFNTKSDQHTIFSKTTKKDKGYFMAFKPSDFVLVWNTDLYAKIFNVSAKAFHKEDVLSTITLNNHYAFDLVADLSAPQKTTAQNDVLYIVHKEALRQIRPVAEEFASLQHTTINWKKVHRLLFIYGIGRLAPYPMVRVKNKTAKK